MNVQPPLASIDPVAIARFAAVVFGYIDGLVPIRMFSETGTRSTKPKVTFPSTAAAARDLQRLAPIAAREGRGLYVVPGTVAVAGRAEQADIIETGVLVIDIDDGDVGAKREHLERHLGSSSLLVASGGVTADGHAKLHLYWRLTEAARGADLEVVRAMREAIALKAGGDTSFASLHQPIRIAGSIHGKHGQKAMVRILADSGIEYDLADLRAAVDAMPQLPGIDQGESKNADRKAFTARDLATRWIREGGVDGITRFDAISKVIGHWVRNARLGLCSLEAAWCAVADHNATMILPPWDEARLRREFKAIAQRDDKNHAGDKRVVATVGGPSQGEGVAPPALSDDALAAAFVAEYGKDWRHVGAWGVWFHWTGCRWQRDEKSFVRETVRQVCRSASAATGGPSEARRIASDKTIAAVLRVLAADPLIATAPSEWDAHPMLLNTPSGIIDLESGDILPHDRRYLISQMTLARHDTGCPRWMRFLDEVTDGDQDLVEYLARLAGYCLTGQTREQMFAFIHGPGGNGKSVFVQTIAAALGDYTATATLDTFMASPSARHLTELAGLRAARLVIVPETEGGRSWAEGRIKTVTGGEKVRANFMHRDYFEYAPQFKLVVMGNHRPALTQVNEGMRRRLHLIPFDVTFSEERRDRDIENVLLAEIDGIFGWMLAGCADWLRRGLMPPARVKDEAAEYFASEDLIGQWIETTCVCGGTERATSRALFASWKAWADAEGHVEGSLRALGEALRARGFKSTKVGPRRDRGWTGIGLRHGGIQTEAPE